MRVNVGDTVGIKAGDERGGWGKVTLIDGATYHVALYGSTTDVRVYERSELRKRRER